jgi:hypothetical protein
MQLLHPTIDTHRLKIQGKGPFGCFIVFLLSFFENFAGRVQFYPPPDPSPPIDSQLLKSQGMLRVVKI